MNTNPPERFERSVGGVVRVVSAVSLFLGLLVVIPLTLWLGWHFHSSLANAILVTLFSLSFGWGLVSLILCFRSLNRLGLDGPGRFRLFSGPRPDDREELRAWQLGWHFMFAVLSVLLCIMAIPFASWVLGR
jgi:hypothetical protein